jgi:hypothetical protein
MVVQGTLWEVIGAIAKSSVRRWPLSRLRCKDGRNEFDMYDANAPGSVAVRLAGGIGDHLLGMRILPFIRERRPLDDIILYSDCAGQPAQLQLTALSPFVKRVIPLRSSPPPNQPIGRLEYVLGPELARMMTADLYIDACGDDMLTQASVLLQLPIFTILRSRPVLTIPDDVAAEAEAFLKHYPSSLCVGVCFAVDDPDILQQHKGRIVSLLRLLLGRADVLVLNFFATQGTFLHWPEPERTRRARGIRNVAAPLAGLSALSARILPCADLRIELVAALLARCGYFIGVDNGIKHLAWALDVPHTFFVTQRPTLSDTLRWMPDAHRMLRFDCSDELIETTLGAYTPSGRRDGSRL